MMFLLKSSGVFIYPLALCSFLFLWVFLNRLWVLRPSKILPRSFVSAVLSGKENQNGGTSSLAAALVNLSKHCSSNRGWAKSFIAAEMSALERGLFLIDGVVATAPLLGLLGTVSGLMGTFTRLDLSVDGSGVDYFSEGISLALSTTFLGLAIAIPALFASVYLRRKLDIIEANLNLLADQLTRAASSNAESS